MPPERLTVDMNVLFDFLDKERDRHDDALTLFSLAERGEVELGIPPQGRSPTGTGGTTTS